MSDDPMEPLQYEAKILDNLMDEMLPHLKRLGAAAEFDGAVNLRECLVKMGLPADEARAVAKDVAQRYGQIHYAMKSANTGVVAAIAEFRDALDGHTKNVEAHRLASPSTGRHGR